jgi:hypothetical protein
MIECESEGDGSCYKIPNVYCNYGRLNKKHSEVKTKETYKRRWNMNRPTTLNLGKY